MTLRPFLALIVCLGLQTSLCTGGALATLSGVSDFFAYHTSEVAPMSYGAIGYLTCENNAQSSNVGSVKSGCGDASDCLLQAFHYSRDQSIIVLQDFSTDILSLSQTSISRLVHAASPLISRGGPVYEHPRELAHTLLKRE